MKQDEEHVATLVQHLTENMTNPFDIEDEEHPDVLINISTGLHATSEVQKSILNAINTSQHRMESFIKSAFSVKTNKSIYTPITKSPVKTFMT